MKDSGCAFKVVDAGGVRYYTSPEVLGLADFARSLHENERDGGGSPLPLAGRIAGAVECPEAAWLAIFRGSSSPCRTSRTGPFSQWTQTAAPRAAAARKIWYSARSSTPMSS